MDSWDSGNIWKNKRLVFYGIWVFHFKRKTRKVLRFQDFGFREGDEADGVLGLVLVEKLVSSKERKVTRDFGVFCVFLFFWFFKCGG